MKCGKSKEGVSSILVTCTSCRGSDLERCNISFKENKPDGVDLNGNSLDFCGRKNEGKILWFSAERVSFNAFYLLFHFFERIKSIGLNRLIQTHMYEVLGYITLCKTEKAENSLCRVFRVHLKSDMFI